MSTGFPIRLRPAWRTYWDLLTVFGLGLIVGLVLVVLGYFADAFPLWLGMTAGPGLAFGGLMAGTVVLERRYSKLYEIERERIVSQAGIFSRSRQTIRLESIRSVDLNQTVIERLLQVGDLAFYTAGSADAEVIFTGVYRPMEVKQYLQELSEQAPGPQRIEDHSE